MIKSNKGKVKIKGDLGQICFELTRVVMGVVCELNRTPDEKILKEAVVAEIKDLLDCNNEDEIMEVYEEHLEKNKKKAMELILEMLTGVANEDK